MHLLDGSLVQDREVQQDHQQSFLVARRPRKNIKRNFGKNQQKFNQFPLPMFQVSRNVQDQFMQGHLFTWYFGVYAAYRVKGRQIKVLSDHHIPVDPNLKYNLTLRIEGNKRMKVYIGFTCYD